MKIILEIEVTPTTSTETSEQKEDFNKLLQEAASHVTFLVREKLDAIEPFSVMSINYDIDAELESDFKL